MVNESGDLFGDLHMPEPSEIRGTDGKTSIEETVPKPRVLQAANEKATRKTGRVMVPTGLEDRRENTGKTACFGIWWGTGWGTGRKFRFGGAIPG